MPRKQVCWASAVSSMQIYHSLFGIWPNTINFITWIVISNYANLQSNFIQDGSSLFRNRANFILTTLFLIFPQICPLTSLSLCQSLLCDSYSFLCQPFSSYSQPFFSYLLSTFLLLLTVILRPLAVDIFLLLISATVIPSRVDDSYQPKTFLLLMLTFARVGSNI